MAYKKPVNPPLAKNITFTITEKCNLDCKYCYEKNKSLKTMSFEMAKKLVDLSLAEDTTTDMAIFEFIGGEPLLEIKLIEQIVKYTESEMQRLDHRWKNTLMYAITTNGTVFTDEVKSILGRNPRLFSIGLSLDGIKLVHDINRNDSYDKLMDDFSWWRKTFPHSLTKSTVNHESLPYIFESVKHLIDLGLDYIYINNVFEDVWQPEDTEIFREQLIKIADYLLEEGRYKNIYVSYFNERVNDVSNNIGKNNFCGCGNSMLSMDTKGNLYPCLRFQPIDSGKGLCIGHVDTGINKDKLIPFSFCNMDNLRDEFKDKCKNCEARNLCTWCTANNFNQTESIFKRGYMACDMVKAQYQVNKYFFNKIEEIERNEK